MAVSGVTGLVVGVDPGLDGALAVLRPSPLDLVAVLDMPTRAIVVGGKRRREVDAGRLAQLLTTYQPVLVVCERVWARPGQGVSGMLGFGRSLGVVEGVAAGCGVGLRLVEPARWTRDLGLVAGKDGRRAAAARLFPQWSEVFARRRDDGRADAVLLAWWGCR